MKNSVIRSFFDRGAVTAEFAIILPAVVLLMGVLLSCGYFIMESVRCHNAAHLGARVISASYSVGKKEESIIKDLIKSVSAQAQVDIIPLAGTSENSAIDGNDSINKDGAIKVKVTCPILPDSLKLFPSLIYGEAVGIPQEKLIQPLFNSSQR